ncbi:MAG TPA: hypothetical protein VLA48_02705 [Nitrososphaeraceae archaeon]|nr:hypothetical protein [Nitrososphaeraceae archaeon]
MITTAIIIYIVSAYLMWRYIKIAKSKDGIWSGVKVEFAEVLFTVIPLVNIIAVIMYYSHSSPRKRKLSDKRKTKRNFNKFFAINDNRSFFQRIQYFLSKGKKFAPDETKWN